ncbi:MAG: sugar phosphate isomerase/epimerase family protein [Pirellulaceae bacterium]|nr:sugar phosphate isomerase/epimerase family protein [Pirellulaceae bacterium]
MFVNLDPGAVRIMGLDLSQLIALAQRHGFEGIDPPIHEIAAMDDPRRAADMMGKAGLQWGSIGLPVDFRTTDGNFTKSMAELPKVASVARQIACERCVTWIMPCHDRLDYQANFQLHARRLRLVAELLADQGIRFGREFVGPLTLRNTKKHSFIHTIEQCLALGDTIGHNCGVLFDTFHWYTSRATSRDITEKLVSKIVCVHVNDAIPGRRPERQLDRERALPCDTGVIDLARCVRALRRIHYDGPVTCEPMIDSFAEEPVDKVANRVASAIRRMMALNGDPQ